MGRDCASERVAIALAEADQRTSGRGHQRRLTSPPLPSRGARRSAETGKYPRCSRAGRRPSQPSQRVRREVRQTTAPQRRMSPALRPAFGQKQALDRLAGGMMPRKASFRRWSAAKWSDRFRY